MPKIYRAMVAVNGAPVVGTDRNMLGARVPPHEPADITPDTSGNVSPCGQGMSVNPSISAMMMVHIPRRWRHLDARFKGARGDEPVEVFTLGEGAFVKSNLTPDLILTPDGAKHGVVEPARIMPLEEYQNALAATQPDWKVLVDPDGS